MNVDDVPIVSSVVDAGPSDRVFDSLLLVGPLVIGLVVLLGTNVLTRVIAGAYIGLFVAYVVYRAVADQ